MTIITKKKSTKRVSPAIVIIAAILMPFLTAFSTSDEVDSCIGGNCAGTQPGQGEVTQSFCEENPESPLCQSLPVTFPKGKARDYKGMPTKILDNLGSAAIRSWTTAELNNNYQDKPFLILAGILQLIVAFVGLIFVIQTIRAGFLWLTARGNEEQVKKAQGLLKASITGIVIMLLAYIITALVVDLVLQAGTPPSNALQ